MLNKQDCQFRDHDDKNTFCYKYNKILGKPYNCEAKRCTDCVGYKRKPNNKQKY